MPRWQARRERFRSILSGKKCIYPGSVFDPISARIAEDLGFEVGMFAGSVASPFTRRCERCGKVRRRRKSKQRQATN